jgi:hypothetical protein
VAETDYKKHLEQFCQEMKMINFLRTYIEQLAGEGGKKVKELHLDFHANLKGC